MIWTQTFMRTAFIFLVMMTVLADQSDADIQIVWIPVGGAESVGWVEQRETQLSILLNVAFQATPRRRQLVLGLYCEGAAGEEVISVPGRIPVNA